MSTTISEQAAVLALVKRGDMQWHRVADLVEEAGSATQVLDRGWEGLESFNIDEAQDIAERISKADLEGYEDLIRRLREQGIALLTVLDDDYPTNLRHVYNRPPFMFVRGDLTDQDNRSVAVVGTRQASPEGLSKARDLARELALKRVTVLSGLARGIDGAAHEATLEAGGRTVAVMGTGIDRIYPPEHEELAARIERGGALVSQFWPGAPPTPKSFPMRNVVMSGMGIGTVVIEARWKSGARMQARLALEHGKRVFLLESLVMQEDWAQKYAQHPLTTVVESVGDVLDELTTVTKPPQQLTLA